MNATKTEVRCDRCGLKTKDDQKYCAECYLVLHPPPKAPRPKRSSYRPKQSPNPDRIDWDLVRRQMSDVRSEIKQAYEGAVADHNRNNRTKIGVEVSLGSAFLLLQFWFIHTDKKGGRVPSTDGAGISRLIYPTEGELTELGSLVDRIMATVSGYQICRVTNLNKIKHAYADAPGFVWYKIGPSELPRLP